MARTIRDEILRWTLAINGDGAKKELFDLENANRDLLATQKQLEAEQLKLRKANDTKSKAYRELTQKIKENQVALDSNRARMEALRSEIGITGLTMAQLQKKVGDLRQQMRHMTPGSAQWQELRAELIKTEKRIGELRIEADRSSRGLMGLANTVNQYQGLVASGIAVFVGALLTVKGYTDGLAQLADAEANVMKTTGMTREEVQELKAEFKTLNTRGTTKELLLLAEEAGRLGKESKKDVMDFVRTANMLKVALGDDLGGEEAIRDIGKLAEQFRIAEKNGVSFGRGMEMLGSAINEVSASGSNQAGYLVDFAKRVSGIDQQVNLGAGNIIGYAAALDESGQSAEVAGTLFNKLIPVMFTDTATYAKIAKMSVEDFTELLQTDANSAFLTLLKGLKGNNEGFAEMAKKMEEMELDGARSISVLASLANNTEKVSERQKQANEAIKSGVSLSQEYAIKNENVAAGLEKIGKKINSSLMGLSNMVGLDRFVNRLAEYTELPLSQALETQRLQLAVLTAKLQEASLQEEERVKIIRQLKNEYPEYLGHLNEEGESNASLFKALEETNQAFKERIRLRSVEEVALKARKRLTEAEIDLMKAEDNFRLQIEKNRGRLIKAEGETLEDFGKRVAKNLPFAPMATSVQRFGYAAQQYEIHLRNVKQRTTEFNDAIRIQNSELALSGIPAVTKQLLDLKAKTEEALKPREKNASGSGTIPIPTKEEVEAALKARDDAFKRMLDQLDLAQKEEETYQANAFASGTINEEQYQQALSQIQKSFLLQRLLAYKGQLSLVGAAETEKRDELIKGITDTNLRIAQLDVELAKSQKANLDVMSDELDLYLKDVQAASDKAYLALKEVNALELRNRRAQLDLDVVTAEDGSVDELDAKIRKIWTEAFDKFESPELSMEEKLLVAAEAEQAEFDLKKEYLDRWKKDAEKTNEEIEEHRLRVAEASFQGISAVANTFNALRNANQQKELDTERQLMDQKKATLDKQLEQKLISEETYRTELAKLEDQYRRKEREIKTQQFKRQRNADALQAGINTALAVSRALTIDPTGVMAIIAGIAGAAQVAAILATPVPVFAKGKYNVQGTDGQAYNANYSGPVKTGFYSQPTLGIFGEKGKELVISGPHTQYLEMNHPEIIRAIMDTRVPTMASGRYTNSTASAGPSSAPVVFTDPMLVKLMLKLDKRLDEGVDAKMVWSNYREFRDNAEDFENRFNA